MPFLRRNTATDIAFGPYVAASDGYTYLATTLTISPSNVILWKANGTVTQLVTTPGANLAIPNPGWILLSVAASDVTSCGRVRYAMGNVAASGNNLPIWREYEVVSETVYDSIILGTDFLQTDMWQISGAAVSAALAGMGIHVSSIAAGVGVNVTSMNGAAVSNQQMNANVNAINGAAPSTQMAAYPLDYVMFTPGAQSITLRDTFKAMAAALIGKADGATGSAMRFYGPSGDIRVSGAMASGNRSGVTWVTG